MRIGIDARFYGGEQSKGLGRYTQKLIEQLATADTPHEFVVFLQDESLEQWDLDAPHITPVSAPYNWYTVNEQIHMPRTIAKQKVDLMHFPHFNVPLLYRDPFIVTIHDLIVLRFPTMRATTLGPLLYTVKHNAGKAVMRHAAKKSQHILTVSEFSKEDIVDYFGVSPEKITVTYEAAEPVDTTHTTDQDAQRVCATYGIERPYLLYVGNAYPHKNLDRKSVV